MEGPESLLSHMNTETRRQPVPQASFDMQPLPELRVLLQPPRFPPCANDPAARPLWDRWDCCPAAGPLWRVLQQPALSTSKSCCRNVSITAASLCAQHPSVAHWQDQGRGSHQPGQRGRWRRAGIASQAAIPLCPTARDLGVGAPCTTVCGSHGMRLPHAQTAVPCLHPLPVSLTLHPI